MDFPADIAATIKDRYVTLDRSDLPDDFDARPAAVLSDLAETYRGMVRRVDDTVADMYHGWSVRMKLDLYGSLPATDVHASQQGKWVELGGVVVRVEQPEQRALKTVWTCAKCNSTTNSDSRHRRPPACRCGSHVVEASRIRQVPR